MALSKDTLVPIWPKDFSTILREGRAADASGFSPGDVVVRINGLLVACDTDSSLHTELPAEMVWIDGTTRQDISRYELDGTVVEEYTTIAGKFIAEVTADLFTTMPEAGDVITKSTTAGKLDPLDATELATFTGEPEVMLQVVGRVVGDANLAGTGFYLCHFDLG